MAAHGRTFSSFLIAVSLCFIVGCAGFHSPNLYSSPHGNFDVPVLDSGLFSYKPARVQEDSDNLGGRVVFYDDGFFRLHRSITYRRLPADADGILSDAGKREAAVRGFFYDYALPELFEPVSRDTEILLEEIIWTGSAVEYFAVIRIPEGSILTDGAGKRLDSIRALLIFPHGKYMYMLGFDNMTFGFLISTPVDSTKVMDLVDYQPQSEKQAAQRLEDTDESQSELDIFAAMAWERLAEFKSTIVFK